MANIGQLAGKLATARLTLAVLDYSPAIACPSVEAAYAVQAAVAETCRATLAGWKVGIGDDGRAMAAPIFTTDLVTAEHSFALTGDRRSVKVEAELGLRLARDLPPRPGVPYDRAEILAAIAEAFCGIELVNSRFNNDEAVDFATRLADNFSHGGYAIGAGTKDFARLDLTRLRCRVARDEASVSDKTAGHPFGDPIAPVVAWANEQCDRLGGLRAGQILTTGTLIDPFPVEQTADITASLESIGEAKIAISNESR